MAAPDVFGSPGVEYYVVERGRVLLLRAEDVSGQAVAPSTESPDPFSAVPLDRLRRDLVEALRRGSWTARLAALTWLSAAWRDLPGGHSEERRTYEKAIQGLRDDRELIVRVGSLTRDRDHWTRHAAALAREAMRAPTPEYLQPRRLDHTF